jgi:hypothetical protein
MNKNQKNFLKELDELMKKYSIDKMTSVYEDVPVIFYSNSRKLTVGKYENGEYEHIVASDEKYTPDQKSF